MRVTRGLGALWIIVALSTCVLWPPKTSQAGDEKPLSEEQVKELAVGPLKPYPDEIVKLVESHGVAFLPTNSSLGRLKEAGVQDQGLSV